MIGLPTTAEANPQTVWINGRFLERPVTGVERVARELLSALAKLLDEHGGWTSPQGMRLCFKLLAPSRSKAQSPWPNLPLIHRGSGGGHLWEQTGLWAATRGGWLLSLCNTGPMLKRRHLLFLHDAQPFAIPANFTWKFRSWYRLLYSLGGRMARAILTNSEHSRDELVRRVGLDRQRITPVWLGVEHVQRVAPDPRIFERLALPPGPYLFAVASANPNKNFAAVVQALKLLGADAPTCVLAGQRYQRVFNEGKLEGARVVHAGYVSDAELYALYAKAECLLFPSFYEGFGLPPIEAMALGCPAIVSHSSVMPEVCGDAVLYCDPARPATLAEAIRRLRDEPGLREELVARGKARVPLFSWPSGAQALLQTLVHAMERERGPQLADLGSGIALEMK